MGSALIGRRSFLAGILGAAAAPAIVKAESLMKIIVPQQRLYTGELGVIDAGFRLVASDQINRRLADIMTREMLALAEKSLRMTAFSSSHPMPKSPLPTIKFRRYAGPILIPSNPLNDLIHGDRKTS